MKKLVLTACLMLTVSVSGALAFNSEDIYDSGGKKSSSNDGGYNYEDYMGKPQSASPENTKSKTIRGERDISSYHFEFEANINPSVVEGRLAAFFPLNMNSIGAALGMVYEKENFAIGNADLTIGNRHNADLVIFDIGFRTFVGSVEKPDSFQNGDLKAVGFVGSVIYNIIGGETFYQMPLNLELAGEIAFAPNPLCFGDAEQITEAKVTLGLDVFGDGKGFIFVGGRYVDIRLNKNSEVWNSSGGSVFGGFKLRF